MIYHDPETGLLFSSFKYTGDDFERDMALMRENPRVREWWSMTDSYQEASLLGACLYIPAIEEVGNFVAGTDSASVIGFGLAPTELGPRSAKQRSWRPIVVETNRRGLLSSMITTRWRQVVHSARPRFFEMKRCAQHMDLLLTRLMMLRHL